MVKKTMYQKIKEFKKQGLSKSEIALKLGITRKTVKKYYNMDEKKYQRYLRKHLNREKVFDNYRKEILEVYERNKNKRLNMASVYDYLEEKYGELPGNEKTLRNYINFLIISEALTINENRRIYEKVPELPYGRQMQLDFGEHRLPNGLKLYIFAGVLSASRYKYVKFQVKPFKTMDVILHLLDCFAYYGGMPEEIVIDQDKLMVVSENHGDIVYTRDFASFKSEMGFGMYVCRKADPETKGKIENVVKYVKRNFLNTREFDSMDEANEALSSWLKRRANGKISQATKRIPENEIEEERKHLKKLQNSIFRKNSLIGREERTVNDHYISVDASYYGLPGRYNNKKVETYTTKDKVFIFNKNTGKEIACYELCLIPGQKIMHREFKRDSEISLTELKNEACEMFALEQWKIFLDKNFERYSRYIRDQCIEARKYFANRQIDKLILSEALDYCLENKTVSISNLHDTYKYYLTMHKDGVACFDKEDIKNIYNKFHRHPSVDVKRRSLEEYKKIAVSGGGR